MDIHPAVVGIDVSKDRLDIFDGKAWSCANTPQAIAPLARRWAQAGALAVLEATGQYDRALRQGLEEAGCAYARVNPGQARDFARATGRLAKTDRLDAAMLAAMGRALPLRRAEPLSPPRERLGALHRRRDQLVAQRQQERTRLKGEADALIRCDLQAHLDWLDEAVAAMDRRIAEQITAEPALARDARLIRSIPGFGPVVTAGLLALVPELGQRSPKAIAALAGLAPVNHDSGQRRGQRTIAGGRKRVRDALYMAAVAASRSHSRFRDAYQRLRQAGKPAKLAFIAIARKLLVTANAVLRDQAAFQP